MAYEMDDGILEIALARLELELRTHGSGVFAADDQTSEILFWTPEIEAASSARSSQKHCVWQAREERAWRCLAHVGQGPDSTTPRLL